MGNKKNIGLPGGPNEIIIDSRGQWDNPGKNTRIPGNNITMKDVAYPVWAQPNVGPGTMMMPGSEHHFKNAEYVDEYPMAQEGGSVLPQAQRGFFSRPKIKSKEETPEESYYNPKVEEDITSGDWKQDFLYNNQWLIDTPFIGDYLKDKARKVAEQSAGESRTEYDLKILDDPDSMYNQREDKSAKYSGWGSIQDSADNRGEVSLMDQYFSEEALFPISPYKPTSDYLEFLPSYSIKGRMDEDRAGDQGYKDRLNSGLEMTIRHAFKKFIGQDGTDTEYTFEDITKSKEFNEFLKNKKTIFMTNDGDDDKRENDYLSNALSLDLGGHKTGIAWDEELNLPYISLSDAWDFSPNHYSEKWSGTEETRQLSKIQASLMHKAGNPFKIYDRFYFDPESQKNSSGVSGIRYYTDAEIEQRKSKIPLDKKQGGSVLPKAQDGTEIPDEAAVADDSILYDLEKLVNKSLGDINKKAKDFSENPEELNSIDNMRHASGGRYAAEAIQQKIKELPYVGGLLDFVGVDKAAGFIGANVMGIGHELRTIFGGDERPFLAKLQEMGEDTFNNYVGSIVGSLDIDDSKKDEVIRYLSYNNLLPDGYVRTEQGKKDGLSEDIYFKDEDGKRKTAYQRGGGLLDKTMKCNSCGWEWKAADGGSDIDTCHKCGGKALAKAQDGTEVEEKSVWGLVKEMAKISGANISNLLGVMGIPANLIAEATESLTGRGDGEFNFMDAMPSFATPGSDDEIFTFTNQNGTPVKNVAGLEDADGNPLVENPVGAFITNLATDPSTYVGAGVLKNVVKNVTQKGLKRGLRKTIAKNIPRKVKTPIEGTDMVMTTNSKIGQLFDKTGIPKMLWPKGFNYGADEAGKSFVATAQNASGDIIDLSKYADEAGDYFTFDNAFVKNPMTAGRSMKAMEKSIPKYGVIKQNPLQGSLSEDSFTMMLQRLKDNKKFKDVTDFGESVFLNRSGANRIVKPGPTNQMLVNQNLFEISRVAP